MPPREAVIPFHAIKGLSLHVASPAVMLLQRGRVDLDKGTCGVK